MGPSYKGNSFAKEMRKSLLPVCFFLTKYQQSGLVLSPVCTISSKWYCRCSSNCQIMEEETVSIDSVTISLPCELLKGCLQSAEGTWEGESPGSDVKFPIKTIFKETESVVEFNLSGLSVIYGSQSIRFSISKAQNLTALHLPDHISEKYVDNHNAHKNFVPIECSSITENNTAFQGCAKSEEKDTHSEGPTKSSDIIDNVDVVRNDSVETFVKQDENLSKEISESVPEKPKPKKRGRKPKSKAVVDSTVLPIQSEESGRKRYGLRGVKLSSAIMEAVKGKFNVDADEDGEEIDDDETDDYVEDNDTVTMIIKTEMEETTDKANAEAQTEYDIPADKECGLDVENNALNSGMNTQKKKSNMKGSLRMLRKFKDSFLNKGKGIEKKKILSTIGNVYAKERRKKNINKTATCKYCGKGFCDYTGVDSHVKKFHMKEADIKEYLDELVPLKQVTCSTCNETFASRLLLQIHEDRDHSKTLSQCTICGKVFKNLQFLRNHIKTIHLNDESHLCHLCSSKFKQAITLKQHIEEVHERQRNVTCSVCGKTFYRQAQLNRHSRIHDANGKKILCPVCGRGFNFECNLQRHLSVVHVPKSEKFHCSYCGKGFNQKATMSAHVQKIHFNLCPFVCDTCKAPFMRSKQLEDHMAQVHNVSDFKIANPREKLSKYNRASDDLFSCSYCKENFYFKAQLVDHVQIAHLDVFPYSCEHCLHGFLETSFLLRHQEKAHGIQPESSSAPAAQFLQVITAGESKRVRVVPISCAISSSNIIVQGDLDNGNLEDVVLADDQPECVTTESDLTVCQEEDISTAASVLVEISNDDNTIQYVIQGGENIDMDSSNPVVHDIASLLLAAEQSFQENAGSVTLTTVDESDAVAMETSEVTHVEAPSVITISNVSEENTGLASIELEDVASIAESSGMEEITVIMKE